MVVAAELVRVYILVEVLGAQHTVAEDKVFTAYFEGGPYHDASMEIHEPPAVLRLAVPEPISVKAVSSADIPTNIPVVKIAVYDRQWVYGYEVHYLFHENIFK